MVKASEVQSAQKHAKKSTKDTEKVISKDSKVEKREKPTASDRKKKQLARRFQKLMLKSVKKNVVYIGHLPKGFSENEIKQFFAQFGSVQKLRVARSKKTARTKGYAFLQFEDANTADVAAKAMHGYMMFGRVLDVHVMDSPHQDTFKHGNRDWKFVPTQLMFRNKKNAEEDGRTDEQRKARVEGLLQKEKEKRDRLKELEIDYDFTGYKALVGDAKPSSKKAAPVKKEPVVEAKKPEKAAVKETVKEPVKESKRIEKKVEPVKKAAAPVAAPAKSAVPMKKDHKKQEAPKADNSKRSKVVEIAAPAKKEAVKPVKAAAPAKVVEKSKSDKKEADSKHRSKDNKKDHKVSEKSKKINRGKK